MKRLIIILMLQVLSCCQFCYNPEYDIPVNAETPQEVVDWVTQNIEPTKDIDSHSIDYWQSPYETYTIRTGDCEDLCIIVMYLLKTNCNIDSKLRVVINTLTGVKHSVVVWGDSHYDINPPKYWDYYKILGERDYSYIMYIAEFVKTP